MPDGTPSFGVGQLQLVGRLTLPTLQVIESAIDAKRLGRVGRGPVRLSQPDRVVAALAQAGVVHRHYQRRVRIALPDPERVEVVGLPVAHLGRSTTEIP